MIAAGFQNIFNVPELKKRIFFTLIILAVYRVGAHVPTPGIDAYALSEFFKGAAGTIFGFFDMFSGGAFKRLTIFALGIMPYISASIILQLLTVVFPPLEKLKKEVSAYIPYEEAPPATLDKVTNWFAQKIPGNK